MTLIAVLSCNGVYYYYIKHQVLEFNFPVVCLEVWLQWDRNNIFLRIIINPSTWYSFAAMYNCQPNSHFVYIPPSEMLLFKISLQLLITYIFSTKPVKNLCSLCIYIYIVLPQAHVIELHKYSIKGIQYYIGLKSYHIIMVCITL